MGKMLRILSIVILVLGIFALVLAIQNYRMREVLIGRTALLEDSIIRLAGTIESATPEEQSLNLPARDISPVTSRVLENPDLSRFWDTYNASLEQREQPLFNFGTDSKRLQLRQYYQLGPDGKRVSDPVRGGHSTRGEGTMRHLLDELTERARAQNMQLNQSRDQLEALRTELVASIEELNREKNARRGNLAQIEEHEAIVAQLNREKTELQGRITRMEQDARELQINIHELRNELDQKNEEIANLKAENTRLLSAAPVVRDTGRPQPQIEAADAVARLRPGDKGTVMLADERWSFVIVRLSDESVAELLGPEHNLPFSPVEMMIRRPGFEGPADEFVTKIRLTQAVRRDNLFIADNLPSWQQTMIHQGDVVFF